jgi:hypothetical protein
LTFDHKEEKATGVGDVRRSRYPPYSKEATSASIFGSACFGVDLRSLGGFTFSDWVIFLLVFFGGWVSSGVGFFRGLGFFGVGGVGLSIRSWMNVDFGEGW